MNSVSQYTRRATNMAAEDFISFNMDYVKGLFAQPVNKLTCFYMSMPGYVTVMLWYFELIVQNHYTEPFYFEQNV